MQTCIIHLIRNTFRLTSRKYWDELRRDIRPIYTAVNEAAARAAFDEPADVGPTLTCFSYLAVAQLLRISQFPEPNYGREVSDLQSAVAADGVMVATACRRLGVRARLASNPVGDDGLGRALADLLSSHGVYCQVVAGARTPSIVVITDDSGSRIWLPFLPDVASLLAELDLAVFSDAAMVYVDCYELLAAAAVRVIRNSVDVRRRIFVNLGGSSIPSPLAAVPLPAGATELVQTNLEEGRSTVRRGRR